MDTSNFHLGDILSITTGRLLSPRHIEGVYDILNFMTGDNLYTHTLPRASKECRPYLLMEMPWLAEIDPERDGVNRDNWKEWLDKMVEKYGEFHEVRPIHPEDHEIIDPIEEFKQMSGKGDDHIITLNVTEDEPPNHGTLN